MFLEEVNFSKPNSVRGEIHQKDTSLKQPLQLGTLDECNSVIDSLGNLLFNVNEGLSPRIDH